MIEITQDILSYNHRCRPRGNYKKTEICIHSTGNTMSTAKNERKWLDNSSNTTQASWHIVIDEKDCIQAIPFNEEAWHCGNSKGDKFSIGIEICESGNREKTINRAIELVKQLMKQFNIPLKNVKRHYDYSGKVCPRIMSANNWQEWYNFKSRLTFSTMDFAYVNAVDTIFNKGIICDRKYWLELTQDNVKAEYVKNLIKNRANKL